MVYGFIFLALTILPAKSNSGAPFLMSTDSLHISASDTTDQSSARLMLLPILFRSPDTGFALGVLPQLIFHSGSSTNPSTLRLDSYYTQENQYHILLRSNNWLRKDRLQLLGRGSLKKWPTSFYGIGNDTSEELKETFTEFLYEANVSFKRRVGKSYFIGLGGSVRYAKISSKESGGILAEESIPGSNDTFISGLDATATYDTRDNHFFPASGSYHQLSFYGSPQFLGSDYSFVRLSADLRTYFSVADNQVFAIQATSSVSGGDVPFRMMPSVGRNLRGYSSARYIDKHMFSIQCEYRVVPIFWRLGFVVFAGTGDVFSNINDIKLNNMKHMAGFGIRYVFFRNEKINIRFDFSFGRQSAGDYIDLTEAY
jgi:outer membrane protein assembly factor BamA